jgi:hypothetical protein
MTRQLSIFDVLRAPPIIRPVDAHGSVIQEPPHRVFTLPHKRLPGDAARIELHQADNGLWMWSASFSTDDGCGAGYRVGEKWGRFAVSIDDALHYAREELKKRIGQSAHARQGADRILAWAEALTLEAAHA